MKDTRLARILMLLTLFVVLGGTNIGHVFAGEEKPANQPAQTPVLADNTAAHLDLPYGQDPLQKLDVYAPRDASDAPVVIFVHGGEWTRHDKAMVSYKPKFLNQNGKIFVSINYRLSPPAVHPAHVNDVAAAVAWVRSHIAEYGGSPKKIVVMGHSAGCHLVTLLGLDPRPLASVGLKPSDISGIVAWSGGSYDLVQKVREGGMYAPYIRQAFGEQEAVWRDASPVTHAAIGRPLIPFLFISVERNNSSHVAAESLAALVRGAGGTAESLLIENRNHFTANHLIGAPDDTTGQVLLSFLTRVSR
jgi:arylformamidase